MINRINNSLDGKGVASWVPIAAIIAIVALMMTMLSFAPSQARADEVEDQTPVVVEDSGDSITDDSDSAASAGGGVGDVASELEELQALVNPLNNLGDGIELSNPRLNANSGAINEEGELWLWTGVTFELDWRATTDFQAGDLFTVQLPEELSGWAGSFPLVDDEGVTGGLCVLAPTSPRQELTCTLNDAYVDKDNVHGTLEIRTQTAKRTENGYVEFEIDGEVTMVELPGGGGIVGPRPHPGLNEAQKSGWVDRNNRTITWQISFPGAGAPDPLVINDTLSGNHKFTANNNINLGQYRAGGGDHEANNPRLTGLVNFVGEGTQDGVFTIQAPAGGWDDDMAYVFQYRTEYSGDGEIPVGDVFKNNASNVQGERTARRSDSGSGTIGGVDRGSFALKKVVEGDAEDLVPADTVFTVTVETQRAGSDDTTSRTIEVPADGEFHNGPETLPVGSTVTLTEPTFPEVDGVLFGDPVFAAAGDECNAVTPLSSENGNVEILDGGKKAVITTVESTNICVTLTNTAEEDAQPELKTVAKVKDAEDDKALPITGGTVTDTVSYTDLKPNTEYTLKGELMHVAADGTATATGITTEKTFTTVAADERYVSGEVDVEFEISGAHAQKYAGETLVVYQELFLGDQLVADHKDPKSASQSFVVVPGGDIVVTKKVTGPKGGQVTEDKDAVFQIEASWVDAFGNEQSKIINVTPGEPVILDGLPLDTEITLSEIGAETSVDNVKWGDIIWSGEGVVDQPGESKDATIILKPGSDPVEVELENKTSSRGLIIIPIPIPLPPGGGSSEPPTPTEPTPGQPGEPGKPETPVKGVPKGETPVKGIAKDAAADQAPQGKGGGVLANTGASVSWPAGGGILLLLVGAWFAMRGRRNDA